MSEQELTTSAAPEPVSTETGQGAGGESRQPAKLELDSLPEFRSWKSTMDKQLSAMQRQTQLLQQQAEAERQRARQLEQQWNAERMQGMSEVEQVQYRAQLLEQELYREREQGRLREQALQRERDLDALSKELGVDREVIDDATDPMDAALKAARWLKSNADIRVKEQVRQREEKRMANEVDIGGGTPTAGDDDLQRRYDRAMTEYNSDRAIDIMHEAMRQGVKLKL